MTFWLKCELYFTYTWMLFVGAVLVIAASVVYRPTFLRKCLRCGLRADDTPSNWRSDRRLSDHGLPVTQETEQADGNAKSDKTQEGSLAVELGDP